MRLEEHGDPKNQFIVLKWFLFTQPLWNEYFEANPPGDILKFSFDYRDLFNIRTAEARKDAIVSPIRIVGRSTGLVGPGSEVSCN
ncbi:MAG: hypothetical protein DI598_17530 [Pseudopedobacter saltans]|uniref:Uncharacterized protein n=1 Tax=Pseudopedobacter saltans TaxID=151895 RepID=A0A2W5EFX9_9SPHI|nr:MAG: hypothetical protein DI598_17530 [Pseudopedobacter saltans]